MARRKRELASGEVLKRFRSKAADLTRQRVLSWQVVGGRMLKGHQVSLQTAVTQFFRARGEVWRRGSALSLMAVYEKPTKRSW